MAAEFPRYDVSPTKNPDAFRLSVSRLTSFLDSIKDTEYVDRGRLWYPQQSRMVFQDSKDAGITKDRGAGIMAAVSPGSDYDNTNVHAIKEMSNLNDALSMRDWKVIEHSAGLKNRTDEARSLLKQHAPNLSRANDLSIIKARDLLLGGSLEDIIDREHAPKTYAFADNLLHPYSSKRVTIDGRIHDMIANRMIPWDYSNRGINHGYNPSGRGRTRYEDMEDVVRATGSAAAHLSPHIFGNFNHPAIQATIWLAGKHGIERENDTMKQGPDRVGQPYFG